MTRCLGRNEFVNAKDDEFNSAAISLLWHPPTMLCGVQINVAGIERRQETWKLLCPKRSHYCCIDIHVDFRAVWLLHNLTLDGKLCLRDDKNAAFV